jgi:hypothetical protein
MTILGGSNSARTAQKTIGLGMPSAGVSDADVVALFKEAGSCPIYAMPTVASIKWGFKGPVTGAAAAKTLGATIDILGGGQNPAGPVSVQQTAGLINGQFQTHLFACAIGVKLIPDPLQFTAQGNAITTPAASAIKNPSPNDFTVHDVTNVPLPASITKATLEYGWWLNYAMWNMVQAYNLRWTYGSLINILDEELRKTAFLPPNAQNGSVGAMDVDMLAIVRSMNDYYQNTLGSLSEFQAIDLQRLGSTGAAGANVGSFRPTRDFELASAVMGGVDFHSGLSQNSEYRTLTNPYILDPGVPPGLVFEENNTTFGDVFRAYMRADQAVTGATVPPVFTEGALIAAGAGGPFNEQTLDSPPVTVAQTVSASRSLWKYGSAFMAIEIKGYEITKALASRIQNSPDLQAALQRTCGASCGWVT